MALVWLLVGSGAVIFGSSGTSKRAEAMVEIAWKSGIGVVLLALFSLFAADLAPSQMRWSATSGLWAFIMAGAALWVRNEYPTEDEGRS